MLLELRGSRPRRYAFSFRSEGIQEIEASLFSEEEGFRRDRGAGRDEGALASSVGSPLLGLRRARDLGFSGVGFRLQ